MGTAPELDEENPEFDDLISPDDAAFRALDDELRELAQGKIRVSQKTDGRGNPGGYMFTVNVDDYTLDQLLEKIRDEYGGGSFRLRVTRSNGTYAFNRDITIAGPIKKPDAPIVHAAPPGPNNEDRFMAMLVQMQENTRAIIDGMREQQLAQAQSTNNILLEVMRASAEKPQPQQTPLSELMALLATSQNLFNKSGATSELDSFLKGVQFGKEAGGDENPLSTMVKTMAPSLLGALEQTQKMVAQQKLNAPRSPAPIPQPMPSPVLQKPVETKQPINPTMQNNGVQEMRESNETNDAQAVMIPEKYQEFADLLPTILRGAASDGDPEVYANVLLDSMPEDTLLEIVGDKNKFVMLLDFLPAEVRTYDEWLLALRDIIVSIIQDEQQERARQDAQTQVEADTDQIFDDDSDNVSENERSGPSEHREAISDDDPPDGAA